MRTNLHSRRSGTSRRGSSYHLDGLNDNIPEFLTEELFIGRRGKTQEITWLQQMLNKVGFRVGTDGIFGEQTKAAVVQFQTKNGLRNDGIVGNGTWTALRQQSGMGGTSTPISQATTMPPQAPAAPSAVQRPQSVQQAPQQAAQQTTMPTSGGGDLFGNAANWLGGAARDVGNFVQQNQGTIQQVQQAAKNFGITLPGQQQAPPNYVMQSSGATPPTISSQQAEALQQKAQSQQGASRQNAPNGTMFLTAEAPIATAARYAVPAVLGVGAGYGLHVAQQKPNLAISILGGAAVAVGTYFIGDKVFPFTPEVIQP